VKLSKYWRQAIPWVIFGSVAGFIIMLVWEGDIGLALAAIPFGAISGLGGHTYGWNRHKRQ